MEKTPDFPALPSSLPPETAAQLPPASPPQPTGSPKQSTGEPTTVSDQVVASARDIPDLIHKAAEFDPELAKKWTGISVAASRTVWGNAATMVVSWAVTKYALHWDPETCALVSGFLVMGATILLRKITNAPATGWFRAATPTEAADAAQPKGTPTP